MLEKEKKVSTVLLKFRNRGTWNGVWYKTLSPHEALQVYFVSLIKTDIKKYRSKKQLKIQQSIAAHNNILKKHMLI